MARVISTERTILEGETMSSSGFKLDERVRCSKCNIRFYKKQMGKRITVTDNVDGIGAVSRERYFCGNCVK